MFNKGVFIFVKTCLILYFVYKHKNSDKMKINYIYHYFYLGFYIIIKIKYNDIKLSLYSSLVLYINKDTNYILIIFGIIIYYYLINLKQLYFLI